MQDDNKNKKTTLGNIDDALDQMMYGYETPKEHRFYTALERRRKKHNNPAK